MRPDTLGQEKHWWDRPRAVPTATAAEAVSILIAMIMTYLVDMSGATEQVQMTARS